MYLVPIFKHLNMYPLFSVQREAVATAARKRDPLLARRIWPFWQKENQANAIMSHLSHAFATLAYWRQVNTKEQKVLKGNKL